MFVTRTTTTRTKVMSKKHEKGLNLEKLVTRLFQSKGYEVRHNVTLKGKSGVEHQIDVYAEFKAPLHTSKVIVECKSYDKPVEKDVVMKLIYEVQDLGVDKGILVTTSYFTADAALTAEGYNVDLWEGNKLGELIREINVEETRVPANVFYVKPVVPVEKARKIADKSLKGFLGRRGYIESESMLFYPFYELDIDAKVREEKEKIERVVSASLLIDGFTQMLCDYDHVRRRVNVVLGLPTLSDEEKVVFQRLLTYGALSASVLASLVGWSADKARKVLQGLALKRVVIAAERQYQLAIRVPDPSILRSISSKVRIEGSVPVEGIKIEPTLSMGKVEELVDLLWGGRVKKYKIMYYPYYACKVIEKGKRYVKAIDMQNGKIDERLNQVLTSRYLQLPF